MSKILIFSDLHLHNWTYGASYQSGWNSRLLNQFDTIKTMIEYAANNKIETAVFCGDFFHTNGKIDAHVLSKAVEIYKLFSFHCINLLWIPGNHDYANKDGSVNSLSWMLRCIPDFPFYMYPYVESKSEIHAFLEGVYKGAAVFLHQGVQGVPLANDFVLPNEILTPYMIPEWVEHVFTGHYHTHRKISPQLTIVGAPMQHTWADEGEDRGFLTYDLNSKEIEFHKLPGATFKTVDGRNIFVHTNSDKFLRIKNFEGDKEKFRKDLIETGVMSVEFIGDDTTSVDNNFKFTAPSDLRIQPVIEQYEEIHDFSDHEKKVGQDLRSGTYEVEN